MMELEQPPLIRRQLARRGALDVLDPLLTLVLLVGRRRVLTDRQEQVEPLRLGLRLERDIARWSGPMWLLLFRATDSARPMPAPIPVLPSVEPGTARSRLP